MGLLVSAGLDLFGNAASINAGMIYATPFLLVVYLHR
jgi:hypothetical protein